MFVHFTFYYVKYNLQKVIKCSIENSVFLFPWGFKMRAKICVMVLESSNLAMEKFWKYYESTLYVLCIQLSFTARKSDNILLT